MVCRVVSWCGACGRRDKKFKTDGYPEYSEEDQASIGKLQNLQRGRQARARVHRIRHEGESAFPEENSNEGAETSAVPEGEAPPPVECIPCLVPHELKGEWLPGGEEYEKMLTDMYESAGEGMEMSIDPRNVADMRAGREIHTYITDIHTYIYKHIDIHVNDVYNCRRHARRQGGGAGRRGGERRDVGAVQGAVREQVDHD